VIPSKLSCVHVVERVEETGLWFSDLPFTRQMQRGSFRVAQRWQTAASTQGRSVLGRREGDSGLGTYKSGQGVPSGGETEEI